MKKIIAILVMFFLTFSATVLAETCNGDFDCDTDCDGTDAATFKADFGRSQFENPCEPCRHIDIPKTGLTECYSENGTPINCEGTGQDGEYQAGFTSPNQRFKNNGDGTVLDNFTGLMWLQNTQCFGETMNWQGAISACENLDLGGYTDWRLPNVNELYTLVDYGQHPILLPQEHPFLNITLDHYWTSTTTKHCLSCAWCNTFSSDWGITVSSANKDVADRFPAWCVRGGH